MNLRDMLPPVLVAAARRSVGSRVLYRTYDEALALCNNGYQQETLVNMVFEKTRRYRESLRSGAAIQSILPLMRVVIAAGLSRTGQELSVIDYGGACGAHYFLVQALFGPGVTLRWHVVETPRMTAKARRLEDGSLKFFDSIAEARRNLDRVDLVYSSSTLQYVPDPYAALRELTGCGAAHLFITRTGLALAPPEPVIIQRSPLSANGIGPMPEGMADGIIKYPVIFPIKSKIEEIIAHAYTIRLALQEDKAEYLVNGSPIDLYGYYGVKK